MPALALQGESERKQTLPAQAAPDREERHNPLFLRFRCAFGCACASIWVWLRSEAVPNDNRTLVTVRACQGLSPPSRAGFQPLRYLEDSAPFADLRQPPSQFCREPGRRGLAKWFRLEESQRLRLFEQIRR